MASIIALRMFYLQSIEIQQASVVISRKPTDGTRQPKPGRCEYLERRATATVNGAQTGDTRAPSPSSGGACRIIPWRPPISKRLAGHRERPAEGQAKFDTAVVQALFSKYTNASSEG